MRSLFRRGLIALLPTVVTILLIYFVGGFLWDHIGMPLGEALKWTMQKVTGQSRDHLEDTSWFFRRGAPLAGLVLGIVLVFIAGAAVATFFGKKLLALIEAVLTRIPIVGVIYPHAKQFTQFFSRGGGGGEKRPEFKNAVAIPFPYANVYSIGFITGEGLRHLNEAMRRSMVTVFVPHSPTPFTGVVCWVPREEIIPLPITVDEALRLVISCGVLAPTHQSVSLVDFAAAAAKSGQPITLPPNVAPAAPKNG